MPNILLLIDTKVEMSLEVCEEEYSILELTFPITDNQFHIEIGGYVCWNKSNTVFFSQVWYAAG